MAGSILDTSIKLFDENGYAETRMQDIADAIGVTRPTLYYYFKNKDEILVALLLNLLSADEVMIGADDHGRSPLERLRELMLRIGTQVVEQPARLRIINRNFAQIPEKFRKEFTKGRRRIRLGLTHLIEVAIEAGDVRPVDPELTTSIIFGAITGIADWYHPRHSNSAQETVENITSMLLTGIAVPEEGRHDGSARGVIRRINEDLAYLEQLYDSKPAAPARSKKNA